MEKIFFVAALVVATHAVLVHGQVQTSPLDRYLETGKTIVIAKCLSVGPVNILMQAKTEVQILLVVKGKETLRTITVTSPHEMRPGERYLLRTENEAEAERPYFYPKSVDSVIRIARSEEIDKLKALSPRIIVLRTMNMRVDDLESQIRQLTYELDALKKARMEY